MRKIFPVYILPIFVLLYFLGCSQDLPAIEETEETTTQVRAGSSLALAENPPTDQATYTHVTLNSKYSLSSQMTSEKTIYEIRNDFNLNGGKLTIPAHSILYFNGGSISNGTVTFDSTYISKIANYSFFNNCSFAGSVTNKEVLILWFGVSVSNKDNAPIINEVIKIIPETIVFDAIYPINQTLVINHRTTLRGADWTESVYGTQVKTAEYGVKTSSRITAIKFSKGGSLNLFGMTILGDKDLYTGTNTHDKENINTMGISIVPGAGSITAMYDCAIVGFTYGLHTVGGYIETIRSSYFSSNRFGMYCCYTSDFICIDCHFNSNMLNYDCAAHKLTDDNPNGIRKIGAGVVLKGTGMTQFIGCRFEFNFIHFMLDEADIITNLQDCIFDAATHSCIMVYNDDTENMVASVDRQNPCINCVNISNNTFARGARCEHYQAEATAGSAIVYVRESNNRGTNFNFSNNVVVDNIEINQTNVQYEPTIFRIYNDGNGGVINSSNNDFSHCQAKTVASAVNGSTGRFVIRDNGSNFGSISHQFQNNSVIDIKKMELSDDGKIVIWNTLTSGNKKSADIIMDPTK